VQGLAGRRPGVLRGEPLQAQAVSHLALSHLALSHLALSHLAFSGWTPTRRATRSASSNAGSPHAVARAHACTHTRPRWWATGRSRRSPRTTRRCRCSTSTRSTSCTRRCKARRTPQPPHAAARRSRRRRLARRRVRERDAPVRFRCNHTRDCSNSAATVAPRRAARVACRCGATSLVRAVPHAYIERVESMKAPLTFDDLGRRATAAPCGATRRNNVSQQCVATMRRNNVLQPRNSALQQRVATMRYNKALQPRNSALRCNRAATSSAHARTHDRTARSLGARTERAGAGAWASMRRRGHPCAG
jgi:hypothetical protein